ncbi:DUF664 domain-containing protein [Georgenia muralis]|uniref:mycothiol transferase n=1 Tax=Georgenia muralis TaxID=154117 RepID=UPI000F4E2DA0
MSSERAGLLAHLDTERDHVLAAVAGLGEDDLTRTVMPSGWSIAQMLNHLTYDVEIFWAGAIVGGDTECIGLVQDGWKAQVTTGAAAVEQYRRRRGRRDAVLAEADLDASPAWWPPRRSSPSRASPTHAPACSGSCWRRPPRRPPRHRRGADRRSPAPRGRVGGSLHRPGGSRPRSRGRQGQLS